MMEIIVCIKQVPATTDVRIDPVTGTLKREGVEAVINPFDEYALEEGVRLKERYPVSRVTVLTMGPPQAEKALREALSRGADTAVHLTDRIFAGADTLATSYTLAQGIRRWGPFDLIICGKQATDGDTAQVGPGVAEKLDIPHVAYVKKIEEIKEGMMVVERMMEDGYDRIAVPLPALITVVKEINTPRLPSLKAMLSAKKATIAVWDAGAIAADPQRIGLNGSPTVVKRVFNPPPRPGGERLSGNPAEKAHQLVDKLAGMKFV